MPQVACSVSKTDSGIGKTTTEDKIKEHKKKKRSKNRRSPQKEEQEQKITPAYTSDSRIPVSAIQKYIAQKLKMNDHTELNNLEQDNSHVVSWFTGEAAEDDEFEDMDDVMKEYGDDRC
ncbi:hypothetical protein RND71_036445 [Anisodus tanguticus]|uniref:Uncharacterized protein n=1 Tax=Anisodus tanguticus TaxID=243964 RepID=A0AAE1R1N5_9SOLA|nr:hypothetical protein RND71_036445 [Anisodus tanguticus]